MSRPRRIIPFVLLSALAPAVAAADPDKPPPDEKADRALLTLRDELWSMKLDRARQQTQKFRPLCDAEGYPLVGNIGPTKGHEGLQASRWCDDVRTQASAKKKTT